MDNEIRESKEYKLAKEWEMAVNSYNFNPKRFAAAIPDMHPTLQQSLYRLIRECIKVMADDAVDTTTATELRTRKLKLSWNTSINMDTIYH